ncbi:MAG: succinate dehydrogenase, cytochrome b556 subunit [Alcaligenaceae bacterium]|uniref:Succinate dehydrogenase cytochrome b556 subunit n=1 Tax=Paenalcaligenes hermetiae TaxID=1157987 RepID=A0ABP9M4K8_9BURK|nr:succinate dehydrogenase, cytochrome b556 subunit [Paenalcaligenes sp.]NLJ62973.1 succinate dehydrogenase, cytochrome b556 subunit [Alcaligenaceae bacterium]
MSDTAQKQRPQYRNVSVPQILSYRMPLAARTSILHRISGALLFLSLPVIILPLLAMSLSSEAGFAALSNVFGSPIMKLIVLALVWGYLHHFCAGIRYLALDLGKGNDKYTANKTAASVLVVSLALTVVFALKLFGVF